MANLFCNCKQAEKYAATRPSYPPDLFRFIASKTPHHHLAWDAGTGNGQAAASLAQYYDNVVATDTSRQQLDFAIKLPNIRYQQTPPTMCSDDLDSIVAPPSTVDLVTVAQALHWFDLPDFYAGVNRVLRRPGGVFAAWCYTGPLVDEVVDRVFRDLYTRRAAPFWAAPRQIVDDEYRTIEFPFEALDGEEDTGPFEFMAEQEMDLEMFLRYVRSWSAYETAKASGVELLTEDVVAEFESAWGKSGKDATRVVKFPVHLRIGRVNV